MGKQKHVKMYKMYRRADEQKGSLHHSASPGQANRKQVEVMMTSGGDVTQTPGSEIMTHVHIYKYNRHDSDILSFCSVCFPAETNT